MIWKKKYTFTTPSHKLRVEAFAGVVDASDVVVDKVKFLKLCKEGCKNFNCKYSCPPFSPHFKRLGIEKLFVLVLRLPLDQLSDYKPYHRVRLANSVLKSRADNVMRQLESETGTKFLSTGSCRLCKPCGRKVGKPCKRPDKMRFSLEAVGIDCNELCKNLFGFPLLWYGDKKAPVYTAVVCALPI